MFFQLLIKLYQLPKLKYEISLLNCFLFFFPLQTEKGKPRFTGGSEAKHSSPEDPRGEDAETDAERRILAKARRGGAVEDGDEVRGLL